MSQPKAESPDSAEAQTSKRRAYSRELKIATVRSMLKEARTYQQIASDLQTPVRTIRSWVKQFATPEEFEIIEEHHRLLAQRDRLLWEQMFLTKAIKFFEEHQSNSRQPKSKTS